MTTAQSPTSKRVAPYVLSLSLVALICAIHLPSRPPYVLVAHAYSNLIGTRGEPFAEHLDLNYALLSTSRDGAWHELVGSDTASTDAYGY
jgi:hypothetical protein